MAFIATATSVGNSQRRRDAGLSVMFSVVFKNIGEIGGNVLR